MKNIKKYTVRICVTSVLVSGLLIAQTIVRAQDTNADPIIHTIVMGLRAREGSVKNFIGYSTKEAYHNPDPLVIAAMTDSDLKQLQTQPPALYHLFGAADGINVREDEKTVSEQPGSRYFMMAYDGDRTQTWLYGSPTASESNGDAGGIAQSQMAFTMQLPLGPNKRLLSDRINSTSVRVIGKETVRGIDTYKLESVPNGHESTIDTWWIAPQFGSIVMKSEQRNVLSTPNDAIVSWRHVMFVDKITKTSDDTWLPTVVRQINYVTLRDSQKEFWTLVFRMSQLSVEVNAQISPTVFKLPLPLGTRVLSKDRDIYTIGGNVDHASTQLKNSPPTGVDNNTVVEEVQNAKGMEEDNLK